DRASAESLHLLVGDRELVESEPLHVFDPGAEVDSPDPRPVDSREAHRTRLRRAEYLRALQRMGSELPARLADCYYFGMCRRIISSDYGGPFRRQNLPIPQEA